MTMCNESSALSDMPETGSSNIQSSFSFKNLFYAWFLEHPHQAKESYLQHLGFTLKHGAYIIVTGLALIAHGLIPKLHQTTASQRIFKEYALFKARWDKAHGIQEIAAQ